MKHILFAAALFLAFAQPAQALVIIQAPMGQQPVDLEADQAGARDLLRLSPIRRDGSGFIATWRNSDAFYVRFFGPNAVPVSDPIQLGGGQTDGVEATDATPLGFANGSSLIFFTAESDSGTPDGALDIFAQRFGEDRVAIGVPRRIHSRTNNVQDSIFAATLPNGNVMAVWKESGAGPADIWVRILNKSGAPVSIERLATPPTSLEQIPTSLAALSNNQAILAYAVLDGAGFYSVRLQRIGSDGVRVGNPIALKTLQSDLNYRGSAGVAPLSGGRYIAAFFRENEDTGRSTLRARIFEADGSSTGFRVGPAILETGTTAAPQIMVSLEEENISFIADTFTCVGCDPKPTIYIIDGTPQLKKITSVGSEEQETRSVIRLYDGTFVVGVDDPSNPPLTSRYRRYRITNTD